MCVARDCDAGTLYSNPDAPEGVVGITPYFDVAEHSGRAGIRTLMPVSRRVTLHFDIRRRWYDDDWWSSPDGSGSPAGHPGWRDDDDDEDEGEVVIIVEDHHHHEPPPAAQSQSGTPAWSRPDDHWVIGGAVTFWFGSPSRDDVAVYEHDVPHVVPWEGIDTRRPPE
jgi:hypothetical protein